MSYNSKSLTIVGSDLGTNIAEADLSTDLVLYWDTWSAEDRNSILYFQKIYQKETRREYFDWLYIFAETKVYGQKIREHLEFTDGFSAWWLSVLFERHPVWYDGAMFEIFKLRALERYLDDNCVDMIILYSDDRRLQLTLKRFCDDSGRKFALYNGQETDAHENRKDSLVLGMFEFAKVVHYFLKWLYIKVRFFRRKPSIKIGAGLAICTWFPNIDMKAAKEGIFRSRYWGNLDLLINKFSVPVHWLLLHFEGGHKAAGNISLRNELEGPVTGDMTFWEECINIKDIIKSVKEWFRIFWRARKLDNYLDVLCLWPNSKLVITPYVSPLWKRSTRQSHLLYRILMYYGIKRWAEIIGPQSIGLAPSELQPWERIFYHELRKRGSPLLCGAMHTTSWPDDTRFSFSAHTLNNEDFLRQLPDKFLCNGRQSYKLMKQTNFPKERLSVVEALRYQYLIDKPAKKGNSQINTLLVTTTVFKEEADLQIKTLAGALRTGLPSNITRILIKAHPTLPIDSFLAKYSIEDKKVAITTDTLLELLTSEVIVYCGNSTTVPVEAAYMGVPCIVQAPENNFNFCVLSDEQNITYVRSSADLIKAVQAPTFIQLPGDFFCLDRQLPRWKELFNSLGIS